MSKAERLFLAGPKRPIEQHAVTETVRELEMDRQLLLNENSAFINTFEPVLNDFINQASSCLSYYLDDANLADQYKKGMLLMHHLYWLQSGRKQGPIANITLDRINAYLQDQIDTAPTLPAFSIKTSFELAGQQLVQSEPHLKPLRKAIKQIYGDTSFVVLAGMADIYSLFKKVSKTDLMNLTYVFVKE